jgi:hypothetical protein
MSQSKNEKTGIISFRLYPKHLQMLAARTNRTGLSVHQEAQTIVECALDDREEEALLMRAELAELRAEMEAIRAGLVTMFTRIVTRGSSETATVEKARAEIERVFARSDKR